MMVIYEFETGCHVALDSFLRHDALFVVMVFLGDEGSKIGEEVFEVVQLMMKIFFG